MLRSILEILNKRIKTYEIIDKSLNPLRNTMEMLELKEQFQQHIISSLKNVSETLKSIEPIHNQTPIFNNSLFKQIQKVNEFKSWLVEQIEKTPESLLLLSKYGWYLDYDSHISLPGKLAELIKKDNIKELDDYLTDYYTERFDRIISELIRRHPARKEIFNHVMIAHKEKLYFVSIPCILSQIDGISNDYTKKKFFIKDKNNKYLSEVTGEIAKISRFTMDAFLTPLTSQTPIMANESILGEFPIELNRHRILHGTDITYGTETNSLKCISLIKYLSDMLIEFEK